VETITQKQMIHEISFRRKLDMSADNLESPAFRPTEYPWHTYIGIYA